MKRQFKLVQRGAIVPMNNEDLRPGDLQVISNHTVVHARTGYTDAEDLAQRRHLLRLWLTLERPASTRERLLRSRMLGELLLDVGRNELRRLR